MGAPAARSYAFSHRWVQAGHKVTVISGIPNHPTGKVYPGYRRQLVYREDLDGIDVLRVWVYTTPNAGVLRRSFNYISYALSAAFSGQFVERPDVVIASSPQILVGLAGIAVKWLRGVPLVVEVRDLWPDTIAEIEIDVGDVAMRLLRSVEHFMYRTPDAVVSVSPAFSDHLIKNGVEERRLHVIPNGVDRSLFFPARKKTRSFFNGRLQDKFIVAYIGTMGLCHGLEIVFDTASILRDTSELHFILMGEGAEKEKLKSRFSALPNVSVYDSRPRQEIGSILREVDAALVLLKDKPIFRTVIPSKLFEAMGCGVPVLLGVDGMARTIIEESGGGMYVEPDNPRDLAEAVLKLKTDHSLQHQLGEKGASYVVKHYNLDILAQRYSQVLENVIS